jgi:hypothetical protein
VISYLDVKENFNISKISSSYPMLCEMVGYLFPRETQYHLHQWATASVFGSRFALSMDVGGYSKEIVYLLPLVEADLEQKDE